MNGVQHMNKKRPQHPKPNDLYLAALQRAQSSLLAAINFADVDDWRRASVLRLSELLELIIKNLKVEP